MAAFHREPMTLLHPLEVQPERLAHSCGPHRDPVFRALAVTHQNLAAGKVDMLDAQPQRFHQPEPAAVEPARDQPVLIIFYMEAADVDFPTRPLPMADEDGDMPLNEADASSLFARLQSVITPISG
jgi:hypothetical protein